MPGFRNGGTPDAHLFDAAHIFRFEESTVGRDNVRNVAEHLLMPFHGGHEKGMVGALDDADVGDDSALRLLHLHHLSELGGLAGFASAKDLRLGLEDADELLGGLGVALEHALLGLRHHLASNLRESPEVSNAPLSSARKRTATSSCALHRFDGLPDRATNDREQSPIGSPQRTALGLALDGSPGDMGDLAHPASDASAHVAKARRGGHPQGPQALDLATHALG